ncbi:MAG TPA: oligosaccharide flippase family protein, partial [Solirubrobacteraceae bacterium]
MRARAASGAALLGVRGVLIHALGIVANLALARMLAPRDFGLVALGTVLVVVGGHLAEGGFSATLIRREQTPSTAELRAVLGLQLGVAMALAVATAAVALQFGRDGAIVAVMGGALPLAALRTSGVILLERRLRYGLIARADVGEAIVYYAWAVGAVALGFGVWGLATAVIARSAAGSAIVLARGPIGLQVPTFTWQTARPLLALGMRYQAASLAAIGRQQSISIAIAAVAGVATLGIWNLAWRVLQVPAVLVGNAGRVVFPAIARLLGGGHDARPVLERSAAMLGALMAIPCVALVAIAVALPSIVGHEWADVPEVILWSCVALVVGSPVNIAAAGYLLAVGEPGRVLVATLVSAVAWLAVTVALVA